jgi:hypothetical protein
MKRLLALAGLVGVLATACEPPVPTVEHTLIVGDSLPYQVEQIEDGALVGADWLVAPGVTASHGFITQGLHDRVLDAARAPTEALFALGLNDASLPAGWTGSDFDNMVKLLDTLHSSTCEIIALPGVGPQVTGAYRIEIEQARVDLYLLGISRGAVVIDWQTIVTMDPTLLRADGIHLRDDPAGVERSDPAAASVLRNFYADGVEQCV